MSRLSQAALQRLGDELAEGERQLIDTLARLHLASHAQLAALLTPIDAAANPASIARTARRTLARLTALGVLARLGRRVGGVRAGSKGYVYYLGPAGQRLHAYWAGGGLVRGRCRPEPGSRYVRHRLSVTQLYAELTQAERREELELLGFAAEPDCWRSYLDGNGSTVVLKPDAFVRVGIGAYEERCFVEVDLGTESRPVLADKLRRYLDYYAWGSEQAAHGVFPRVLLLTNTEARRVALAELVDRRAGDRAELFTVALLEHGLSALTEPLSDIAAVADNGGWT